MFNIKAQCPVCHGANEVVDKRGEKTTCMTCFGRGYLLVPRPANPNFKQEPGRRE